MPTSNICVIIAYTRIPISSNIPFVGLQSKRPQVKTSPKNGQSVPKNWSKRPDGTKCWSKRPQNDFLYIFYLSISTASPPLGDYVQVRVSAVLLIIFYVILGIICDV